MNDRGKVPSYTLKPIRPMLAWPQAEVLLFDASHAEDLERAKKTNWKCYQLGGEGYEQLIEDVHVDIRELPTCRDK